MVQGVDSRCRYQAAETRLLYGYFARVRLESVEGAPPDLSGRTVGELIEEQRSWEHSHADLIAERQQHDADWRARASRVVHEMETALAVRIQETRDPDTPEATRGHQRSVIVRMVFENVGNRIITEVEGAVRFSDVYNRDLFDCTASYESRFPLERPSSASNTWTTPRSWTRKLACGR